MDLVLRLVVTLSMCCWVKGQHGNDWKITVQYYDNTHLSCSVNETSIFDNTTELMWILPTGDLVKIAMENSDYGHYHFSNFGHTLHVASLNDADFGVYYCLIKFPNGDMQVVKRGINVNGPYYGDLLQKYKTQVVSGAIAAAVMFAVAAIICLLCNLHHTRGQRLLEDFREENPGIYWQPSKTDQQFLQGINNDAMEEQKGDVMLTEVTTDPRINHQGDKSEHYTKF